MGIMEKSEEQGRIAAAVEVMAGLLFIPMERPALD
jgi:hypothetical protein